MPKKETPPKCSNWFLAERASDIKKESDMMRKTVIASISKFYFKPKTCFPWTNLSGTLPESDRKYWNILWKTVIECQPWLWFWIPVSRDIYIYIFKNGINLASINHGRAARAREKTSKQCELIIYCPQNMPYLFHLKKKRKKERCREVMKTNRSLS